MNRIGPQIPPAASHMNNDTIFNNTRQTRSRAGFPTAVCFERMCDKVNDYIYSRNLHKLDDSIYEPVAGIPYAYRLLAKIPDFVNKVLEDDDIFNSHPRRRREIIRYLRVYNNKYLRRFEPDSDVISFKNGVLVLPTRELRPHMSEQFQGAGSNGPF